MNSLGFDKDPSKTRVVVAMSGGVDSSVVAALLSEEGYDVVGITLQLYDHGEAIHKEKACCAGKDIYDARRVAEKIGIPHYVLNYQTRFQESVIDKFADSYLRGETPIPCVLCNQTVKFVDLLKSAKDLCADALATGHYIRRTTRDGKPELHRARDVAKDQSYFLFSTTHEQLEFLRFPLGDMHKNQAREHAARFGLSVAIKPDSQDICFVPDGRYAEVVRKLRPGSITPGEIVDVSGKVLGRHRGIIDFTVGQRRRLGIGGLEKPLYVLRIDPLTHQVTVGPRSALQKKSIDLTGVNWIGSPEIDTCRGEVAVKIRSMQDPIPAAIKPCSDKKSEAKVLFKTPERATATGQACVFYQGDRLLGGGWIR